MQAFEPNQAISSTRRPAIFIAVFYLVTGCLWILFSDRVLEAVLRDQDVETMTRWQTIKGWGYVFLTAALLYWLVRQALKTVQAAEASRRATAGQYEQLLEQAADGIFVLDGGGRIQLVNSAGRRMAGLVSQNNQGKLFGSLFADGAQLERLLQGNQLPTDAPALVEGILLGGAGGPLPVEVRLQHLADGRFHSIVRDITERQRALASLRESEARYRQLFDLSPLPMWLCDMDTLRFLTVNEAAIRNYGFTRAEFLSMTLRDIRPADELPLLEQVVEQLREGGPMFTGPWRHRHKDGRIVFVELASGELKFADYRARMTVVKDITQQLAAEQAMRESVKRFEIVCCATSDVIWDWDLISNGIMWNDNFATMFGYPPINGGGGFNGWADGVHPEDKHRVVKGIRQVVESDGRYWSDEYRFRRADGSYLDILDRGYVMRDAAGKAVRMIGAMMDITPRKRMEAETRRLNAELEHRVQERTVELEATNKELEAFSYSVSHDLRAPLRAIEGFARILSEDYSNVLDAEGRRVLGVIDQNTRHMGQLIDDLLMFSRLSRKGLIQEQVDMRTLFAGVLEECRLAEPARRVEIELSDLPPAIGDRSLLRQAIFNLASNAFKFTRPRGIARLSVTGSVIDQEAHFQICDNGVGFDERYADKLFGVFQRLHRADEFEGTGVGLAIVQRVIHRHGGRVSAASKLGQGATFHIILPHHSGELIT